MLKHISVTELRLGMYVHEFCGSGIEQSFWKNGFMLTNVHDLQRILDTKVAEVWIDESRGIGLSPSTPTQLDPALPPILQAMASKPIPAQSISLMALFSPYLGLRTNCKVRRVAITPMGMLM